MGMKNGTVAIENRTDLAQEVKNSNYHIGSAILVLGAHAEELKSRCQRDINTLMFIEALIIIAKMWRYIHNISINK
jgi:hypothetical protein